MAVRCIVSALAASPLALSLLGCGGGGDPSDPGGGDGEDTTVRILEWVASNNVPLYRTKTEALSAPTLAEEGNLHFDMYEDVDPDDGQTRIWQYLVFKDKAAHTFHKETDIVVKWIEEVIDPGTLTSPNRSELVLMKSLKPNDLPAECVQEKAGLHVITALSVGEKPAKELAAAAEELLAPFRATSGVLYHELLVPVSTEGKDRVFGDVAEILYLKDEAVLTALRASAAWTGFTGKFGADLVVIESKPKAYTELPLCEKVLALV